MNSAENRMNDTERDDMSVEQQPTTVEQRMTRGPRFSPRIYNQWDIDELVADFKARYRHNV